MKRQWSPLVFAVLALSIAVHTATAQEDAQVLLDAFDTPESEAKWEVVHGDWAVERGAYCQRDTRGPGYRYALVDLPFDPVLVTVDATPLEKSDYGFSSFGLVIKYVDASNWMIVRFGSYGGMSILSCAQGKKKVRQLGPFVPEEGRTYKVALARLEGRIAVLLDGVLQYVLHAPWPEQSGRAGVFTESKCRFDDFQAHAARGAWDEYKARVCKLVSRRNAASAARIEAAARLDDGVFEDDFELAEPCLWRTIRGRWKNRQARLEMTSDGWARYTTLAPVAVVHGSIEGTAVPVAKSAQGRGVFGAVVKWIDAANWVAVRYGEYGGVGALVTVDGELKVKGICKFSAMLGQSYRFKVEVTGGRVVAYCDGKRLGEVDAGFAGRAGRPGLYTEAPAAFDDVRITGAQPLVKKVRKPVEGNPALELEFAAFRPTLRSADVWAPGQGAAYLYVRNQGTAPAETRRLLVDGVDADLIPESVTWFRQRPSVLKPGGVAEIIVRFSVLPPKLGLALLESPRARPSVPITVEPWAGKALHVQVPVTDEVSPLQINYIGFDRLLRRLFVYVQQNAPRTAQPARVLHLSQLSVNGHDVTARSRFGQKEVGETVVPIIVDLPKALREGQPAVVCVGTREGEWAGHAVRAFPGQFHIQVTLLGKQSRPDAVEDVYRHAATCIGLCGASEERLLEAKALGLAAFYYGRAGLAALRRALRPQYPPVAGFWLDEMDKLPVRYTFDLIQECESAYEEEDEFIPLQMINLCRSRIPSSIGFYELGDAVCSAYGFHGGALGEQFGRVASIPQREYRLTRRTFTPYFRDAEMPVVVDPEAKKVLGREPKHRRCIEPKEERWMTYGCLIQGAKGIMHWNYGAGLRRPPGWFSKTQWAIRASMGGPLGKDNRPHGYEIPAAIAEQLQRTWDEIGRINVELRAIGPLVAVSDVSNLARVAAARPELSPAGEPAAEAAALVSGLDSIVLIVLSHNLKTNWTGNADRGIESYDPVDVDVELRLPPWLEPKHTFRVSYTGVQEVDPQRQADRLLFRFDKLEVSEVVVVTERDGLMASMAQTVDTLRARLERKAK